MTALEVVLLIAATGEAVAIGVLLARLRQLWTAVESIRGDVRDVLTAAERAAEDPPRSEREEAPAARPIGFRP